MIRFSFKIKPPKMTSSKASHVRSRAAKRPSQAAKVGLEPGVLIHLGERKTEQSTITLIEYGDSELVEYCFTSVSYTHLTLPTSDLV